MATLQEVVNTAYLQALGRPADPDGLKHYVAQLESGKRVDGRRIGIGDILADLNYAAATGVEDKAANQAITARGGWDFAPPPPPPAPSGGGGGGGSSVTPPNVVAPPSSEYDYISDLYTTYLGRGASAEELASYAKILGPTIEPNEIRDFILGGVTSGEISSTRAADLLKTLPPPAAATEPLTAQGLYNQFLGGRPALEKDLQFWNDYIAQYGPEQAMAAFDAAADQERDMDLAARAASLRDQELARDGTVMKDGEKTVREGAFTAQDLYNEYLGGRSALPADIDFWNNYIAVYGPDKARAAFQESAQPEKSAPIEERVASLRAQNLTVPGSLLSDFETQRKATPAEVRSMYLSVLGREPDPEGFSYYTSQPIENLRQSFYQASLPETEKRVAEIPVTTTIPTPVIGQRSEPTAQELYLGLGRAPDPAGLAFWESYSQPNREADFATGAAEKGEQYDPTKPMTIGLPGQTTTTSLSGMTPQQRDLSRLVVSKMPQPVSETTMAPSVFSPENVAAQLELERLRLQPTPEPPAETPVAGFAQGGMVNDDINRMLRNQQSAIQRESQSRQMLNTLGAPPVKKFSDGGPAGSSSGVRRLKMSGYQAGGDVTDEMFVGTRPEDFPETSSVDKKAGELLRALSEGTRGFVGAEPIEPGSEAYRTGQALANMPAVGVVAATAKGAGKAKDALKALTKKDIKLIASELETSRGQLAELAKKYPQLRDASVADIEALTKGEPFTAFRGISLLPGRELRKESTPSMTVDPSVALGMLKDAPVMITKEGFITATPVLRQYPGMKASETQVYVPSLIEQITERQPGALEMKIPTRSGEKMTVADVFKEVKGEKELLADVSKKEPRDILFDRYQGGVGDRYLMEVARRVLAGKWDGGEALLKEIGGYQTDPKGLVQEFDSFAELVKESALKKAEGGEVTNDEFIQEMMTGTRPTDETTSPGILPPELREAIDVPLDLANLAIRGTAGAVAGPAYGLYKGITGGKYGTQEGVKEADTEAARMMAKITGEPKTQAAKDVLEFIGSKAQEYKLDAALPQLLTLPSPGPGAASALMRSYELAETPPLGTVKLAGDKGVKPATPPTDQMGFYSPAEKAVMGLPQDKGTASQMLAQITKTQGVKPVELRATGLEDYLKGKGNEPVTKQEIQDFLTNNRVQVDEVVLGRGQTLSPEAKKLSGEALSRMEEVDEKLASYFEGVEEVAGQDPYSAFIMLRSSIGRRAAKGDQEALDELNAFNLPPEIKDLVLEFGRNKNEYIKYTSQARKMEKPKFDRYNTSGGTNAREIYLTLPGEQMPSSSPPSVNAQGVLVKPMYATQPKFTAPSPHSVSPEADANRLAHIFLDERKDAKGNNVLFVQEMQSDWAQQGRDKGFFDFGQKAELPEGTKIFEPGAFGLPLGPLPLPGQTDQVFTVQIPRSVLGRSLFYGTTREEALANAQSFVAKPSLSAIPSAPFVTNTEDWLNLALKRVIKEAVDNDIDTVAFIKGGQAADKYSLRTFVDYISADRGFATGDDLYVSITPKDSLSPHAFYVGPDGIIKEPISADVRSKFLGEPLSKVIGKETAEKLLSTKIGESQVLRDEGLTLGGKGMEGFYDNILPKTAEKLLKKLGGGKVEPVQLEFGELQFGAGAGRHSTVKENYLGFKITPEMKEMVKTEGLPKFAAGGEVTDFIKRAA
jgi:hypothetical protein